jgi:hypothetical protein
VRARDTTESSLGDTPPLARGSGTDSGRSGGARRPLSVSARLGFRGAGAVRRLRGVKVALSQSRRDFRGGRTRGRAQGAAGAAPERAGSRAPNSAHRP